jgi:hypothetical protein
MSMRDKIAEVIREGEEGALLLSYEAMADAIIKALPDYEAQQARIKELKAALVECRDEIDSYIRNEYPHDNPVQERYRQRDFESNPARITLKGDANED